MVRGICKSALDVQRQIPKRIAVVAELELRFIKEGRNMRALFGKRKRKITWLLLVLALTSQLAISCGAKDSDSMTQAMEQVKASETEPRAEESPVIEVKESDWERGGKDDISLVAGYTEIEFAQGDQDKSVTRDVRFVNHAPEEMDTIWTSADESVITNEGKVTRKDEDKTVTITADVSYNGKKYRKNFTLTVKRKLDIDVNSLEDYSLEQLDEMNSGNKEHYEVEMNDFGYVDDITGFYSDIKVDSWETALASLYNVKSLMGIRDVFEELQPDGVAEWTESSYRDYSFQQYYKGVEVWGCGVSVSQFTDGDGRANSVSSDYFPVPWDMDVQPQITVEEAEEKAEQAGYGKCFPHDEREEEKDYDDGKLYIVNDEGKCRLVWYITTTSNPDDIFATYEVVVDAKTGEVVYGELFTSRDPGTYH